MTAQRMIGAGVLIVGAMLAGCANTPEPKAEIAVSKTALDSAVSAGGAEFAPLELKTAQDKMAMVEKEMDKKNYLEARRLAEEVAADAKLAEAKAHAMRAEKAVQDAQQGQRALREEINRQQTP
jgi:hypothetical protein